MLIKWAIGGAVIGAAGAVWTGTEIAPGMLFGGIVGVVFRKWVLRNFWM